MITLAAINEDGTPNYTITAAYVPGEYPEGLKELPPNVSDTELLENYVWIFGQGWENVGPKPANYMWDSQLLTYVVNIEQLTTAKSKQINQSCRAEIYGGFTSTALDGTEYHYPANDKDQSNMVASVADSYNPDNSIDWVTPFWCANPGGVWGYRNHTARQMRTVGADGKRAISASLFKNAALQQQIFDATTETQLAAITW